MVTEELHQKRVDGARTLLGALEVRQRIGFRKIVTDNESWIYLHMSSNSIWIRVEETAPTRSRTTIASIKAMLTVFWGIRGVTHGVWLPQGASFNGTYFDQHILQVIASDFHAGEEKKHCPSPLAQIDIGGPKSSRPPDISLNQ
jgi:hypothetical protein